MTSVVLGSEQSDVIQGGQITLTNLFETFIGSGQGGVASGVTVGIDAAEGDSGGSGTPLAPTSAGLLGLSASLFQYVWNVPQATEPGDYAVTWTGTVAGQALTYQQTVTVAAMPASSPAPGTYATIDQYQAWSGDQGTPQWIVGPTLRRASELMDHYTIAAVYATNANGMPTDAMVIDAFMRATCAQAQFMIADDDVTGVKRQYSSRSFGGTSASRSPSVTAMTFPPLAPQAAAILHTAGIAPSAALISW